MRSEGAEPGRAGGASRISDRVVEDVRKWGWRGALFASATCAAAAVYYYARFLAAPQSQHIYGEYLGLRSSGNSFVEYSMFWLLAGAWMRIFSVRVALATAMAVPVLVLNVAFAWSSGVLGYVLLLIPKWLPQFIFIDYLSLVQFPTTGRALDLYYLAWLAALFILSTAFFKSGLVGRLVRSLEFTTVVVMALPVEVFLFDRHEFGLHVMDAQVGTSLLWFSNADLLVVLAVALFALGLVHMLVLRDRVIPGPRHSHAD
jgi:hypothetical protein